MKIGVQKKKFCIFLLMIIALLQVLPITAMAADTGEYYLTFKKYRAAVSADGDKTITYNDVTEQIGNLLEEGMRRYKAGTEKDGDDGYYKPFSNSYGFWYETSGFEKSVMGYISQARVTEVELHFSTMKKAVNDGKSVEEVQQEVDDLLALLKEDADILDEKLGYTDSGSGGTGLALATFGAVLAIIVREGLEAILILGAIVAYLIKTENKKGIRYVYGGAILALVASFITETATAAKEDAAEDEAEDAADDGADLGFSEVEIFSGVEMEFLSMNGVYFQPVDMTGGYKAEDYDCHLELDVKALENGYGYGTGMVSSIARGLGNVSRVIGVLVGMILLLSVLILIIVFAVVSNERRKEFAVLRIMGASKSMLFRLMGLETSIVSLVGALIGLGISCMVVVPVAQGLHSMLDMPLLLPKAGWMICAGVLTIACSVFAGFLVAEGAARRIVGKETGLLLREDI